jgi:protein-S-isoprenylcysteine O-methyltransferase Ste14
MSDALHLHTAAKAMYLTAVLRWLPLVTLLAMMFAAKVRAAIMQRRGLRVIVVDWDRPRRDLLYDTLVIAVALFWIYLLLAEAWPLSLGWLPDCLTRKIVDATLSKIVGAVLVLAAPLLFAAALQSLGESWRMGIDREQPGPLVASGLYAWSRNPIYAAFFLVIVGAWLIHGRVVVVLFGAALMLLIHGVALREELFLAELLGDFFQAYRQRVGRYSPWL